MDVFSSTGGGALNGVLKTGQLAAKYMMVSKQIVQF